MFAVIVSIQNPDGLLLPGMNAEVDVSIASRSDVLTIPVMALRTERDVSATAGVLGIGEDELRRQIEGGGNKADGPVSDDDAPPAPQTLSLMGRTIELPAGVQAAEVRAIMQKRRSGGTLSDEEQKLMRRIFTAANAGGGNRRAPQTDYRFGGNFWVVAQSDDGARRATAVRTGITDLDRVEIVTGLDEGDRVLILPSAHLIETQEQLQQFINRRVGTVPGMGSR